MMYTLVIHEIRPNERYFGIYNYSWSLYDANTRRTIKTDECETIYGAKSMAKTYIKKLNRKRGEDIILTLNEKGKVVKGKK